MYLSKGKINKGTQKVKTDYIYVTKKLLELIKEMVMTAWHYVSKWAAIFCDNITETDIHDGRKCTKMVMTDTINVNKKNS